jgi:quinol monooxygenase YgiN
MYARLTTMQVQPEKVDDAVRVIREAVMPTAQQQRGFKNLNLLVDAAAGRVLVLSWWETEQDLAASENSGYFEEQIARFGTLLAGLPFREVYEVKL